jgi:hypothetical protein
MFIESGPQETELYTVSSRVQPLIQDIHPIQIFKLELCSPDRGSRAIMQGGEEKSSQGHNNNINNKNSGKLMALVNNVFLQIFELSLCQVPASIFSKSFSTQPVKNVSK